MSIVIDKILAASPNTERGRPTQLSTDPKGERIAYASGKSIFLRSLDDPSQSKQYISHTVQTTVARFSPSGYYVASGDVSGSVKVWDAVEGVNTKGDYHIISGRINDIAWDGDSQRIIAVGDGRERFGHCITADSGNSIGEISGHSSIINTVSIRQQRPIRAATGADDSSVVFLNGVPFKFTTKLGGLHKGYVNGVGFSPDGSRLVSVGADRRIQLYDGKTGEATTQIGEGEHKGSIFGVSWARDSKRFVTASADQTIKLWDVEAGKAVQTWRFGEEGSVSIPDHQVGVVWPAGRSDGMVVSLNLAGDLNYLVEGYQQPTKVVQGHNRSITALGSSEDSKAQTFWTGSFEGRVCSWDSHTGLGKAIEGQTHSNQVTAFQTTPSRAYSVGWDDTLRIADASNNTFLGETSKLSGQPKGIASAEGRVFVATTSGIDIFSKDTLVGNFPAKNFTPTAIAASGPFVAVGDDANAVHIYTVDGSHKLSETETLTKSTAQITTLAFSPNGSFLAAGNSSGKIIVYDSSTWAVKTDRWSAHTARVICISWNSEGTHAVSGGLDTNVFVWSLQSPGQRVKAANAHKDGVNGFRLCNASKSKCRPQQPPNPKYEKTEMSSPLASDGPAPPSSRTSSRFSKRNKLKNGTFILPTTGERVRRQITLRDPASFEPPPQHNTRHFDDPEPLIPPRRTYSQAGTFRTAVDNSAAVAKEFWQWLHTPTAKGVLKCSLAYLLGSMGTFLPPLASFLGTNSDGKHMVATITVYFHPARSAGSMAEAGLLGFAAFLYATFISISSMAVSVFFGTQLDLTTLAHALVLIVFCGGGLGFVGWIKQKFNTPLVSVACSTTSLAIVTVLTKENAVHVGIFTDDKIVQVMKMVIMGMAASTAVSLLVWPVSSRTELRDTMIKTTDSMGSMLTMITRGFLSGSETDLRSSSFNNAQSKYRSVFKQLTKNLREAKFEHYFLGTENQYKLEAGLVNCMHRLAQSIGGLRSAATTQFSLLRETTGYGSATPVNGVSFSMPQMHGTSISSTLTGKNDRFAVLTAIEEASEEGSGTEDQTSENGGALKRMDRQDTEPTGSASTSLPTVRTPAEIFSRFIMLLGPSMKSLAYTLSQILEELPFGEGPEYPITINEHFQTSLTEAFSARSDALKELYKSKELDRDRSESVEADFEEVAASCGHFSFSLQAFAEEMQTYLSILEELKEETENRKQRSWNWIRIWRKDKNHQNQDANTDPEQESLIDQNQDTDVPKGLPDMVLQKRESKFWEPETDGKESTKQEVYRWVLSLMSFLERDDIRFAIKVGIGAALWALFAFIPATRPIYRHWRGEWGLVSFMLVCSMTIGASNTTGYARFIGTFIGAISSTIVWIVCQENPYALAFCGWLFSIPCFWLIVAKGKGPLGRFTVLTYNLSCLYAYSLSIREGENDEDEGGEHPMIVEIAMHRLVAVISGVVWGLVISRMIWPISARQKFKDGLSLLWLRMGLIWKRDPLSTLLEGESPNSYMNLREEFALQRFVLRLDNLRGSATSEFELRGPFPSKAYGRIMDSTNKLLDAFHAMNVVMTKEPQAMLASSLKLEFPINDALPSAESPRDRLLAKIFQYRKHVAAAEDPSLVAIKDEDYELLYAYVLVTGQLAEEIKKVEKEVEDLFGVMDEDLLKLQ
ncbi:hypothetical protein G7Y89_g1758 [Cudoniella acicularis]|uniref:Anaphase-promoting complex subunit 4 WD40 domain-containing protein n=1 Tax=Cudoniella acicularis TaxID=354080 RepID=A0A8H4RUK8_9HELO|nr:hypothetical protein G7Y89_g1758 [Cudoniella acicularis]